MKSSKDMFSLLVLVSVAVAVSVSGTCTNPKTGVTLTRNTTGFFPYAKCLDHLTPDHFTEENKQGILPEAFRWPYGVIPYVYERSVDEWRVDKSILKAGMELITNTTCLTFVPRTDEVSFVSIGTNHGSGGCFCEGIGMRGGRQYINLEHSRDSECVTPSTVAHELLHAAGLFHEHSRSDRDKYIKVDYDNICKEAAAQYFRCDERPPAQRDGCSSFGYDYNVESIMHYPGVVRDPNFSVNMDKPIMESISPTPPIPNGDNAVLTPEDIAKINTMYNNCK